ncbi:MAG: AMP-binding protein [Acidobacteriaceae bacterium]
MRKTLISLLDDFRRHGQEIAIVEHRGVRRYPATYAQLLTTADRFALELMRRSIHFGDRVVFWGKNSALWVGAMHGCIQRGVIVVPLDAAGSPAFARRVLQDVKPGIILADPELLAALGPTTIPTLRFDQLDATLPESQGSHINHSVEPDTPVQILFTSGTTAEPKGIVHTHRNILSSLAPIETGIRQYIGYERYVHPLRFLHTLPLSHVFGQFMGLWIPPLLAAQVHYDDRLQPQHLLQTLHDDRISLLVAVPRVLALLRTHLLTGHPGLEARIHAAAGTKIWARWWRFRKIHALLGFKFWALVCGGAALPTEVEDFWSTLGFALIQGYGMTESSALITLNHPFKIGKGTIGKPLPGRDVRLTGEGEILVRGPMISTATWRHGALHANPSEWLSTGDLAQRDLAGNLRFVGRKSQTIVTPSGLNIYPQDIEAVLMQQPGVAACAIVPHYIPLGSEPAAILLFHGSQEEAQQAILAANTHLAEHQRIRYWKLWPGLDLPRTSTGKVQLRPLTDWINSQTDQPATSPANDPLLSLLTEITSRHPESVTDATRLEEDFGLDSLGRVQLQDRLESTLGAALDDHILLQIQTLGELRTALGLKPSAAPETVTNPPQPESKTTPTETHAPQPPSKSSPNINPDIYPRWPWSRPFRALRFLFTEAILRPLVWLFAVPRVHSALTTTPAEPLLIVANHISTYDVPLVLYGLPRPVRRRIAIAMAADLLRDWRQSRGEDLWLPSVTGKVSYWLVTALLNVFPLPRSAGFRRSFYHAGLALDRNFHVLIFPEGHRTAGTLAEFRSGIGLLVQESNAPVLPVALAGLSQHAHHRKHWFHAGTIEIRIGQPLRFDPETTPDEITRQLHNTVEQLLNKP